jgi:hypothetical protein
MIKITSVIVAVLLAGLAHAQETPSPGMRSLDMISDQDAQVMYRLHKVDSSPDLAGNKGDETAPTVNTPSVRAATPTPSAPAVQTLTLIPDGDEAKAAQTRPEAEAEVKAISDPGTKLRQSGLWPRADLVAWPTSGKIAAANTPDQINAAILAFEAEPGRATPQDLMDIAILYATQEKMDLAARYYYAAQLRQSFDDRRFPRKPTVKLQGDALAGMIGAWAVSSSGRMMSVRTDVQTWDAATPYAYRPLGPLPDPAQNDQLPGEGDWPRILADTRAVFFGQIQEIAVALKRMGK